MMIANSDISLAAQHTRISLDVRHERLRIWVGEEPAERLRNRIQDSRDNQPRGDRLSLSDRAQSLAASDADQDETSLDAVGEFRLNLLKMLLERLTGKDFDVMSQDELQQSTEQPEDLDLNDPNEARAATAASPSGFGVEYDYYQAHYESEQTSFSAEGQVQTSDGKTIDFSVSLHMSREFFEETRVSLRLGDAVKDPLVINFNGTAAEFTDQKLEFDIDADGRVDQIATLKPDSGLLALDKNGNNQIDDGSELFGPLTGNGYNELAQYDADQNSWIDENDSVYERLRIWVRLPDGTDQLSGLADRNVGAIYLGHIATPFSVNDQTNQTLAQIRDTGLYLQESGGVGTMQQLDLIA